MQTEIATVAGQLAVRQCFDFQLVVPTQDLMFGDIVSSGVYEPYVMVPLREAARGRKVLDVGANIGIFTVACGLVAESVIAVEASPQNAKILCCNLGINGLTNVTVYPVAASDIRGLATFMNETTTNKVMRALEITPDTIDAVDMTYCTTLDDLVGTSKIDVMKIDIEGREYAALQGAKKLLQQKPVIFLEYSPIFVLHGCGVDSETFFAPLFAAGYHVTILYRDMTIQECRQDLRAINAAYQSYMDQGITHLDLRLAAPAV